jgi:cyclophilin family peptidyl-prolyl cis-trans isomerase
MYARLFSTQAEWVGLPPAEFETWLKAQANLLELDQTQFQADLTDPENVKFVQRTWDINSANKLLFTPILVINNNQWPEGLPKSYEMISAVVKLTLLEARQFTTCPPMEINPQDAYTATIHTTKGELVLQLFADKAPLAVNSFVFLARHGWYNNVSFHRVIPGFMAQAGDPTGTGFGGPGYAFQNEIYSNVTFDQAGVLAMANAGPDTNGSQFFITYEPTPNLNGGYTIFGQLIEGLDVLQALTPRDPSQEGDLPEPDVILRIEITESSQ